MGIGCADDPPADPGESAARWDDADGVVDVNRAGPDHPAIQCELPAEEVSDATENVEVLLTGIRVDRGDDASLPPGVHTDEGVTDRKGLPGKVGFEFRRHSGENKIGPQSSDVVAEQVDRTVGGHQQVQDVEPFGGGVRYELRLRAGMVLDDPPGRSGVPAMTLNRRRAVRSGDGGS